MLVVRQCQLWESEILSRGLERKKVAISLPMGSTFQAWGIASAKALDGVLLLACKGNSKYLSVAGAQ